ncbi:copper amine oxidase N-terminal domain-containing protein [Alkaliphilus hydrothermalis]|uniref:Copper amine oxidase-like N-terminal domain-containing protein n=1 Tax=Alkaliphilus hydrothermalis TaxID=1482730 RepID=A0ABS2NN59_9FIRM|nr:copper amine oxidase N-terminal domain-containing protein [Alkaliphilus hydrothermalis]MBM7614386.1 hypothetical protein [Alkaliphilus hydrothermalis]
MKSNKVMVGLLSASILLTATTSGFAADIQPYSAIKDGADQNSTVVTTEISESQQAHFNCFTGTVKEIREHGGIEGAKMFLVEDERGGVANIIISQDTYVVNATEIKEGVKLTGFYDAFAPMIMIYPAQYNARVAVVGELEGAIKVDEFDKGFLSRDQSLKLNVSEDTKIVMEDGSVFEGSLADRDLVVFYDITTRSIPAQTTPNKIVVLTEKAVPVGEEPIDEDLEMGMDFSTMEIIVENSIIPASAAYMNELGFVMVPLRSIAESLGYEIKWDGENKRVMMGKGISLTIGKDYYTYMKTAPIQLGSAPEIKDGSTFVPLSFFRDVVGMNNAYVFEGQIVIDDGEKME